MTPWNWLKQTVKAQRVRTPTLLQMEAVECGAAALGIVLAYYGRIVPLAELRQACGVSRDGSKASNMVKAARLYGLEAKGFRKNLDSLRDLPLPFIVFWHFNHFLVVEGWGQNRVFLNDPGTGPRSVSWAEFDEGFTGVVLLMQPGADFRRGGHKPSLAKALWDRLKGSIPAWVYTLLLGFLLVLPGLVIPVFSQVFVDQILIGGRADWLRPLVVAMVGTMLLQGVLRSLQLVYLRQLKLKLAAGMNGRFIWHILRLPISFYAQRYAGEISSRVALNDQVANLLSGQLGTTLIDLIMLLFYAAVMFTYDGMLTWIGIGAALVNVIVLQWVARQRVDANLRLSQDLGKLSGVEISGIQSIETLKASASESDFFARWAGYYAKYLNAQQSLDRTNQTIGILPPLLSSLTAMLILVFGGLRVIEGHLSIGMLVAFQGLMTSFQLPIRTLVNFGQELQNLESDLYRLDDVLQNPIDEALQAAPTLSDRSDSTMDSPQLRGDVEFNQVTFGYSRVESPLIESFNLRIKPGQRVALVGGSGSGKSTVAKLACGLYQPWSGEMTFDGQHRSEIPPLVLAQSLAMVEQDIFLFGGTVRDNLTLWDDTVPDADLIRACRDAEIHETILALPGGYDSLLLEGAANLSGGQRQRLEIARALINNPAILVLDEATSALDAETEQRIDRNLRRRGCSCLLIAHRLSTIRDCDWILVLDRGQVVEQGTHAQLWAANGPYTRLIQSEGEALRATESGALSVPLDDAVGSVPQDGWSPVPVTKRGDLSALFAPLTPPIHLQPYERFALSSMHAIGWVTSGPVAITAIPPASEYPSRPHHLFDLDSNTGLFSIPPIEDPAWTLVAIALDTVSLQPLSAEALDQAVRDGASEPIKALQRWCQQLQDSLQPLEMRPSLPQWSQVASVSETLAQFHRQVLAVLADWADQHRQAIWQQLNRKAALNQSATTGAVRQLAAAINPTQGAVVPQGSPLLVAAGAVGHAQGIRIQPIRASENPDQQMDPILAIARASQVRVRRVLLHDRWWQQDAGPLLGHLREDHIPVAILPKPSGIYEVLHPQTQQRLPVTRNAANQLEAIAYTFYRSFPATRDRLGSLFSFALEQQGKTLVLTLLAGVAVTLLGMLTPQATGLLMDYAIPNADTSAVLQMGLGLGTAALASTLF
ncbi:MAG: NHLP family bacteriocin export ABC transporter peptidase/permease/ATPase subunit, partial [Thermosynechococcaceae cyanobacterium]